jgi:hypothetical protein
MGQYYQIFNLDKKQYLAPRKLGDGTKLCEFSSSSHGVMAALTLLLSRGNGLGEADFPVCDPLIGSWAGDRVVVSGDYAPKGKFTEDPEVNLWQSIEMFEDASESILMIMAKHLEFREVFQESIFAPERKLSEAARNAIFGAKHQQPHEQDAVLGGANNSQPSPRPFDLVLGGKKNQSWRIFNLDKKQKINAEDFNNSSLMDILTSAQVTTALAVLLSSGNGEGLGDLKSEKPIVGSWAGDRIVVCGSLSNKDNLFSSRKFKNVGKEIILALADDSYVRESLMQTLPTKQRKLIA